MANGELKNTLDLVLSDDSRRVDEVDLGEPLGTAEQYHLSLRWTFHVDAQIQKHWCSRKYAYRRGNYESFALHFANISWSERFKGLSTEERYESFLDEYKRACDLYIPKSGNPKSSKPPWLDQNIQALSKRKSKLWHKVKANRGKDEALKEEYRRVCRVIKSTTRPAQKTYEEDLVSDKKNPKRFYAYINGKKRVNTNITAIKAGENTYKKARRGRCSKCAV